MTLITSRRNSLVARFRALAASRPPGTSDVLLDGAHLVADALDAGIPLAEVAVAESAAPRPEIAGLLARLAGGPARVSLVNDEVMAALSPVRSPSGTVAVGRLVEPSLDVLFAGASPLVLAAWEVQDPGNAGAIVRVADASGATGVLFSDRSADPFGWKSLRGAMGSTFRIPVASRVSAGALAGAIDASGCRLAVLVPRGGTSLFDADLDGPLCCLVGGEGGGVPEAIVAAAHLTITIPMRPGVESLNVAVSAALVAYEARRRRGRNGEAGRAGASLRRGRD